jgi:hypothetical protein
MSTRDPRRGMFCVVVLRFVCVLRGAVGFFSSLLLSAVNQSITWLADNVTSGGQLCLPAYFRLWSYSVEEQY